MSIYLAKLGIYLSINITIYLYAYLSREIPIYLVLFTYPSTINLPTCLYLCPAIYLLIYLHMSTSIYQSIYHLHIYISTFYHLHIYIQTYLPTSIYIYLSINISLPVCLSIIASSFSLMILLPASPYISVITLSVSLFLSSLFPPRISKNFLKEIRELYIAYSKTIVMDIQHGQR